MFNRFAEPVLSGVEGFKTFSISTSAVRRPGHPFFEFVLRFLTPWAVSLQHADDRSGHAVKDFLTSEVTTAFAGSRFNVPSSRLPPELRERVQGSMTDHSSSRSSSSKDCFQLEYGRRRLTFALPLPPYFSAVSRTAPAPEDFTMAKFVRSNGLRVVRLLASKTSMATMR